MAIDYHRVVIIVIQCGNEGEEMITLSWMRFTVGSCGRARVLIVWIPSNREGVALTAPQRPSRIGCLSQGAEA
jgi:hypothetical protein